MSDDVLINKAATIERCVARAREEYNANPQGFETDYTRQDAAILNIQRACNAAIDMGQYLVRRERLGIPQRARDAFDLLATHGWIDTALADSLKRMTGFRNLVVHDYQSLQLPIAIQIIQHHLDDFLLYTQPVAASPHTSVPLAIRAAPPVHSHCHEAPAYPSSPSAHSPVPP